MQAKAKQRQVARRMTLSVNELAQALGVGTWKVYQQVERGELPCVRVGRAVRIPLSVVKAQWPGVFDADLSAILLNDGPSDEAQGVA